MPETITLTDAGLAFAGLVALVAYALLVFVPAWTSYGRVWERIAAGFLTLYILATLLLVGAVIGVVIVLTYDRWA